MAPAQNNTWNNIQDSDAKRALADDKYEDCTACRVTGKFSEAVPQSLFPLTEHSGSAAFIGLGVYSYYTGMSNLRKQERAIMQSATKYKMGSRQLGIISISATLVGLGVWRAFN